MNEQKFYLEKYPDGTWRNFQGLLDALGGLRSGRWVATITRYKKKRSLSQNAYYYGCVIPLVRQGLIDMGFEADKLNNEATHELLKAKFLKEDLGNEQGEFVTVIKSTTQLSTVDFMEYIEQIYQWSSEFLGIVIAAPGEQSEMF